MVWNHMILIFLKQANPSFEEHMTPPLPLQKKKNDSMAAFMILLFNSLTNAN